MGLHTRNGIYYTSHDVLKTLVDEMLMIKSYSHEDNHDTSSYHALLCLCHVYVFKLPPHGSDGLD